MTKDTYTLYIQHAEYYKHMYLDAYVAASQCQAIGNCQHPDDLFEDLSEKSIFICFDMYKKSNNCFNQPSRELGDYSFKSIQKDSMRCMLLYLTIYIKQFLMQYVGKPIDDTAAKLITKVIMKKTKII